MPSDRAPRWSIRLPDLAGKHAVVTGASDGIGLEIARGLAAAGADVTMPVRNRGKGERAIALIRGTAPTAGLDLADLDLGELGSVRASADALMAAGRPIDLLVLNAGVIMLSDPTRYATTDGFELHFQTNHLGHVALVAGILPLLSRGGARVTVQSSMAAKYLDLRWDDLQLERGYSAIKAYGSSKVALSLFGLELGRRSAAHGWGITTNLSHPGISNTNIGPAGLRENGKLTTRLGTALMNRGLGGTPAESALPALYAVASMDAEPGGFYGPGGWQRLQGAPHAQRLYRRLTEPGAGERIWAISEELAGVRFPVQG